MKLAGRWKWIVVAGLLLAVGCGRQQGPGPLAGLSDEALAALDHDLFYYAADTLDDGTRVLHADYVYFYLMEGDGRRVRLDANGRPLASALLYSQVVRFVEQHPEYEDGAWTYRVSRQVTHVRDGQVVRRDSAVTLDDVEIDELIEAEQRGRVE
jgi:hypothetical protein